MVQVPFGSIFLALLITLALISGLALVFRRSGAASLIMGAAAARMRTTQPVTVKLDARRRLQIIELNDVRFVVLTGGRSDVLLQLPSTLSRERPEDRS